MSALSRPTASPVPRRRAASPMAVVLAVALALLTMAPPGATPARASEALGHAAVIAQGVAGVPSGDVVWVVGAATVPATGDAPGPVERPLGFVYAPEGGVLVTDEGTGARQALGHHEAAFQPDGTSQVWRATGDTDADVLTIDLLPAGDAGESALLVSEAFELPGGDHDVDLVHDLVWPGETGAMAIAGAPVFFYVLEGALEMTAGDQEVTLLAGEGALVSGNVSLQAGDDEATRYLAAAVGDPVGGDSGNGGDGSGTGGGDGGGSGDGDGSGGGAGGDDPGRSVPASAEPDAAEAGTGLLRVSLYNCGALVSPGADDDTCVPATILDGNAFGFTDLAIGTGYAVGAAPAMDGDTYLWPAMPAGDYAFASLGAGPDVVVSVDTFYGGTVPEGRPGDFSVVAGGSTDVEIRARPVSPAGGGDTGDPGVSADPSPSAGSGDAPSPSDPSGDAPASDDPAASDAVGAEPSPGVMT